MALRTGDERYNEVVRFWARIFAAAASSCSG
jgi:hypothetical protein